VSDEESKGYGEMDDHGSWRQLDAAALASIEG